MSMLPTVARHRQVHAFSLVELLVCLAVMLVVLSLALPVLKKTIEQGRLTRWLALTTQHGANIILYAGENKEVYPNRMISAHDSATQWYEMLIDRGYYTGPDQVDPEGMRILNDVTYRQSLCVVSLPKYFVPMETVPPDDHPPAPVRLDQLPFPAGKGIMQPYRRPQITPSGILIPHPVTVMPASFADGSGALGDRFAFNRGEVPVFDQYDIGIPVWSTWGGYLNRDR